MWGLPASGIGRMQSSTYLWVICASKNCTNMFIDNSVEIRFESYYE